jgi:hypothetical protein
MLGEGQILVQAKSLWLLLLTGSIAASAQDLAPSKIIRLQHVPKIRKGVDAWPLIANPDNDAKRRINATLSGLNQEIESQLRQCDADWMLWAKQVGQKPEKSDAGDWQRQIHATMLGPRYLSLLSTNFVFCGGAHPDTYTDAAAFDLRTGNEVDPLDWFSPSAHPTYWDPDEKPAGLERSISVPGMVAIYEEFTAHDCDDTFEENQAFLLWPDAASGKVMIQADHLPGCCEACGTAVGLTAEQARLLGFTEEFLLSIAEAHRYSTLRTSNRSTSHD